MKIENNLSFSSDVAETLGLECAVILSQYNNGKLDDISSLNGLLESIEKDLNILKNQASKFKAKLIIITHDYRLKKHFKNTLSL